MDLRQLNALLAIDQHGSFSAAADALLTVQSNVSTHVARLERELGATLVDRAAGKLTAEGEVVVERARRVTAELEALTADVASMRSEVIGSVRLGIIGSTARWLVPRLLEHLQQRHPKVHIVVIEATSTSLEPQLASGALDLAVVNLPAPHQELVTQRMFEEDLVLVVPGGHPLAARAEVALAELDGLEMLMPPEGTALRTEIDAAASAAGAVLIARAELDGVRLIASLTFEGLGAAILPASAIPGWLRGDWHQLAVEDLPKRCIGLAQRRRGLLSAPARAVVGLLPDAVAAGARTQPGVYPLACV